MDLHQINVRTPGALKLTPGTTLRQVLEGMDAFLTVHNIEIHPMMDPDEISDFGRVTFDCNESFVHLNEHGHLHFFLDCRGPGFDFEPAHLDKLRAGLMQLLTKGGALAVIDRDVAPGAPGAFSVRIFGPNEAAIRATQIEFGLDQAELWLRPALGDSRWNEIVTLANS